MLQHHTCQHHPPSSVLHFGQRARRVRQWASPAGAEHLSFPSTLLNATCYSHKQHSTCQQNVEQGWLHLAGGGPLSLPLRLSLQILSAAPGQRRAAGMRACCARRGGSSLALCDCGWCSQRRGRACRMGSILTGRCCWMDATRCTVYPDFPALCDSASAAAAYALSY